MASIGKNRRLQVTKQTLKDDIHSKAKHIMPPGYRLSSRLSALADASLAVTSGARRFFWVEEGGDTLVQRWLSAHGHKHNDFHPLFVQQIARRVINGDQFGVQFPVSVDEYIRFLAEFESSDIWPSLHDPERVLPPTLVAQPHLTRSVIEYIKVCEDLAPILAEQQQKRDTARMARDQARAVWAQENQLEETSRPQARKASHEVEPQIPSTDMDSDDEEIVMDRAEELTKYKDLTYRNKVNVRVGLVRGGSEEQQVKAARRQVKMVLREKRMERKKQDDELSSLMADFGTTDESMDTEP